MNKQIKTNKQQIKINEQQNKTNQNTWSSEIIQLLNLILEGTWVTVIQVMDN